MKKTPNIMDAALTARRMANMKRIAVTAISIVAVSIAVHPTSAHAEGAATVNRGACISELTQTDLGLVSYQAPGQTGNGPLIIVNSETIIPAAFDGAVGCSR